MTHSLSEAGREQVVELAPQAKFVPVGLFFFSGCKLKEHREYTHSVRELTVDVQEARLS